MAINKKLIHFNNFSNFNSKKLSANAENTKYTIGIDGSVLNGDPEILYQSIVYIKDILQQWTHGLIYESVRWSIIVQDLYKEYFTINAIEDSTFSFTQNTVQYSMDGTNWNDLTAGSSTPTVNAGGKIYFKATNPSITSSNGMGTFSSTGKFNISGNIMSMLYGDDFTGQTDLTDKGYAFSLLFNNCAKLVDASELILPATTLANYCYHRMFLDCTSLTSAPELPATTLAYCCYQDMFYGCTSLITAPELPATTLKEFCYTGMFGGCISLITAPELPATTLVIGCYFYMFDGCSNLNKITMLATDISASNCLNIWVKGVASTGTFTKHPEMTSLPTGASGIPEGWTVVDNKEKI